MASKLQSVEKLVRSRGSLRARDLVECGLPTIYLARLVESGRLVRHSRGVYAPADLDVTERHDWELACTRVPNGVLCLTIPIAEQAKPRKIEVRAADSSKAVTDQGSGQTVAGEVTTST